MARSLGARPPIINAAAVHQTIQSPFRACGRKSLAAAKECDLYVGKASARGCTSNSSVRKSFHDLLNQASQLDHIGRWGLEELTMSRHTILYLNNGGYGYKNSQFTFWGLFLHASLHVVIKAQAVRFVVQLFGTVVTNIMGIVVCQCYLVLFVMDVHDHLRQLGRSTRRKFQFSNSANHSRESFRVHCATVI